MIRKIFKKNYISLIFIFVIVIIAMVCATACFEKESVLLGISVTCNNIEFDYDDEGYLGKYSQDSKPDLNYTVHAIYSGGKTKKLDSAEYGITYKYSARKNDDAHILDRLPDDYQYGYYYIEISYESKTFTLYFEFDKITSIYRLATSKNTWKYGESQPILSVNSSHALGEYDVTYKYVKAINQGTVTPTAEELSDKKYWPLSEEEKRLEPGDYFLFAEIADLEFYNAGITDYKRVTVEKSNLINTKGASLSHQFNSFTYEFKNVLGNACANEITLCNVTLKNEINANMLYSVPIKIVSDDKNDIFNYSNYQNYVLRYVRLDLGDLSDLYNDQQWYCNIKAEKGKVYVPKYLTDFDGYVYAELPVGYSNYWSVVSVVRDKGSDGEKTLDLIDENNKFEIMLPPGVYIYTLSLKDKDNFVWVNKMTSEITTEDKTFTLRVN